MKKITTLYALLMFVSTVPPAMADDSKQAAKVSAEQYGATRVADPVDEWLYWQKHYDELEAAAKAPTDSPRNAAGPRRNIVAEVEGCKYAQRVEIYQKVYWVTWDDFTTYEPHYEWSFGSINCANNPTPEENCSDHESWVPKELGEKCVTLDATKDASTMLQSSHGPSLSMQMWLEQVWSLPPGYAGENFSPFDYNQFGQGFGSSSSYTQTWTTNIPGTPIEVEHSVKIWSCALSGLGCDVDVHVVP